MTRLTIMTQPGLHRTIWAHVSTFLIDILFCFLLLISVLLAQLQLSMSSSPVEPEYSVLKAPFTQKPCGSELSDVSDEGDSLSMLPAMQPPEYSHTPGSGNDDSDMEEGPSSRSTIPQVHASTAKQATYQPQNFEMKLTRTYGKRKPKPAQ